MAGYKHDKQKVRMDLLPHGPLTQVAEVMTYGAKKYEEYNWAYGMQYSRIYSAAQRHLFAWYQGEDEDPETELSHLAHAICNLLFLLQYETTHPERDDRPTFLHPNLDKEL